MGLKIGFFVHAYPPSLGGLERFSSGLALLAQSKGHEVTVFVPASRAGAEYHDEILVHRIPVRKKLTNLLPQMVAPLMEAEARRANLDLCHAFEYRTWPPIAAANVASALSTPLVWSSTFHPSHKGWREPLLRRRYDRRYGARIASTASVVAYLSQRELDSLQENQPVVASKIKVNVPPVVEKTLPSKAPEGPEIIPGPYTVFLGRLEEYKGWRSLVLAARLAAPNLHVIFIGPYSDADLATILNFAARAKMANRIHVRRFLPESEKNAVLRGASFYCQTSNYESFGIALVEALGMGIPCGSTPTGIAPELLSAETLFQFGDVPTLSAVMRDMLETKYAQATPEEVYRRFSPVEVGRALARAYALANRTSTSD